MQSAETLRQIETLVLDRPPILEEDVASIIEARRIHQG
jgi:hypothetical protein